MDSSRPIRGSCHCGNIKFVFARLSDKASLPARECACSFCQKHGGVWTSDPKGSLRMSVADVNKVDEYRFGSETAEFYVCLSCGVVPLVLSRSDEVQYAVVNVNTFDDVQGLEVSEAKTDFSGEATEARLDRRKKNWIADVKIVSTLA